MPSLIMPSRKVLVEVAVGSTNGARRPLVRANMISAKNDNGDGELRRTVMRAHRSPADEPSASTTPSKRRPPCSENYDLPPSRKRRRGCSSSNSSDFGNNDGGGSASPRKRGGDRTRTTISMTTSVPAPRGRVDDDNSSSRPDTTTQQQRCEKCERSLEGGRDRVRLLDCLCLLCAECLCAELVRQHYSMSSAAAMHCPVLSCRRPIRRHVFRRAEGGRGEPVSYGRDAPNDEQEKRQARRRRPPAAEIAASAEEDEDEEEFRPRAAADAAGGEDDGADLGTGAATDTATEEGEADSRTGAAAADAVDLTAEEDDDEAEAESATGGAAADGPLALLARPHHAQWKKRYAFDERQHVQYLNPPPSEDPPWICTQREAYGLQREGEGGEVATDTSGAMTAPKPRLPDEDLDLDLSAEFGHDAPFQAADGMAGPGRPWGQQSSSSSSPSGGGKCVPLKQPIPSKFQGDADQFKDAQVPEFTSLINFPAHMNAPKAAAGPGPNLNLLPERTMRGCVMCGETCLCSQAAKKAKQGKGTTSAAGAGGSNSTSNPNVAMINPYAVIPKQNKGLCTLCDVNVWVVARSGLEIKWCKGCKNFRPWAAFGEKGLATKCGRCRERQKEKYAAQKKEKEERAANKKR